MSRWQEAYDGGVGDPDRTFRLSFLGDSSRRIPLTEGQTPQVRALAQDFSLLDSTGTSRTLSSFLDGGSLLLIFYRGYRRPFCLRQLAEFRDLADDFRALGVQIAALAVDPPEQSDRVRRQYALPFPILCDTEKNVARAWVCPTRKKKAVLLSPRFS